MSHDSPITIVGAGPVGLSLALGVARHQQTVHLIDHQSFVRHGQRSIALSAASVDFLQKMTGAPAISDDFIAIQKVQVSQQGHPIKLQLPAIPRARPLGYVVLYDALLAWLHQAITRHPTVFIHRPDHVAQSLKMDKEAVAITLASGTTIASQAMVVAEGTATTTKEYQDSAVLTTVEIKHHHAALCAYEHFYKGGVIALLPLNTAGNRYALVWCSKDAQSLIKLDEKDFLAQLQQHFGWRVGHFSRLDAARELYPLALKQQPSEDFVRLGNAAQTLHPVAAQGLNVGLRDVAVWLALWQQQGEAPAPLAFDALRARDRKATTRITDGLSQLPHHFSSRLLLSGAISSLAAMPLFTEYLSMYLGLGWRV